MSDATKAREAWTRRASLRVAFGLVLVSPTASALAQSATRTEVLVVSRQRLLSETETAKALQKAEIEMTAELQRRVDEIKAQFNAEEQELARLRPTMERTAFDARVAEFDRNVRRERRQTQFRAAALQTAFREARLKFVEALGPVMEEVRAKHGAVLILNADQALALDHAADVTDEVIERVNQTIPVPPLPDLDKLDPGPEMPLAEPSPDTGSGEPGAQ